MQNRESAVNDVKHYEYDAVLHELPDPWLVLTLGLPAPLESGRVAVKTEPYPGRWTHHFVLSRPEEPDAALRSWIQESYAFAEVK